MVATGHLVIEHFQQVAFTAHSESDTFVEVLDSASVDLSDRFCSQLIQSEFLITPRRKRVFSLIGLELLFADDAILLASSSSHH